MQLPTASKVELRQVQQPHLRLAEDSGHLFTAWSPGHSGPKWPGKARGGYISAAQYQARLSLSALGLQPGTTRWKTLTTHKGPTTGSGKAGLASPASGHSIPHSPPLPALQEG